MPGHIIVYKAIQDDGTSYWPDVFPIEVLNRWYIENGPISYASQYQSSPMDLSGNFLKVEYLNYYLLIEKPELFENIICYIDPSTGEGSDYFAMCVAGKLGKIIYVLDLVRQKTTLEFQGQLVKDMYATWQPSVIMIETTGQQKYLKQYLEETTMFNIGEPDRPWLQSGKDTRFATCAAHLNSKHALLPGFKNSDGIWEIQESFNSFKNEWLSYPKGGYDDTLDAVAGAIETLITSVEVASVIAPESLEEAELFIERVLQRSENSDKKLTDQEKAALEEYYREGIDMSIRQNGYYRGIM